MKIFIVDDHEICLTGLSTMLQDIGGVELIGKAWNGKEFLGKLEKLDIDLVFMDIRMPFLNGIKTAKKALKINPKMKIIGLSSFEDINDIYEMMGVGASGFMFKNSSTNEFKEAVNAIKNGAKYYCPNVLKALNNKGNQLNKPALLETLNEVEKKVLLKLCKGYSTDQIAEELNLSIRTIERYKTRLLKKTKMKNTINLIIFVLSGSNQSSDIV